ncbi:hypothetical protein E4582_05165 [Luteimonas yindakuii]|uniref:Uncharacterized protein n=1 Tax=Luteimonas yindakuii TaxID=2565782 RepID=A0A4Z1R5L6_9GAMM|nr:hypothetical protein [Luteimonas yindakuii]TKS54216.1 hypothetical protein E4582_05165 [Luteimonas yindakuii]
MQVEDVDVGSPALPATARDSDRALRYADAAGDNVLLLGQHSTTRSDDNGVAGQLRLQVAHHVAGPHESQPFREAWRHTEVVECRGLDFDGHSSMTHFSSTISTVTDSPSSLSDSVCSAAVASTRGRSSWSCTRAIATSCSKANPSSGLPAALRSGAGMQ